MFSLTDEDYYADNELPTIPKNIEKKKKKKKNDAVFITIKYNRPKFTFICLSD